MNTKTKAPVLVLELNLRTIMEQRNLSVKEVSFKTGITRSALYMMLDRMPHAIHFQTIAQICHGLDITPGDLMTVRSPKTKEG